MTALLGGRLRRHRMVRTGAATAHAQAEPPLPPLVTPGARPATGSHPADPHRADLNGADSYRAVPRQVRAEPPGPTRPAVGRRGHAYTGPAAGASHWPTN